MADAYGLDTHDWIKSGEKDLFAPSKPHERRQAAHRPLQDMDSHLGQIAYTVARVNVADRFTSEAREQVIHRLAEELQAGVDKFKYDTALINNNRHPTIA